MVVYVLNRENKPLMPCSPRKARILLKEKKATVIRREPFTTKLINGSSYYTQDITLGVDTGSKYVGLSASSASKELYSGELKLRNDITMLISERRILRKSRRSRKTRYRKSRFNNRKGSNKEGWLAPSIKNKLDTHIYIIAFLHKILPITRINVEVANFNIEELKNNLYELEKPGEISYLTFQNIRSFVLYRDRYLCQHCKGSSRDKRLHIHHIESQKTGGNAPNNLITVCATCHDKHHSEKIKFTFKRGSSFRDVTFMNILKPKLVDYLKANYCNVHLTYGFVTSYHRELLGLKKDHYNDAFCIAGNFKALKLDYYYKIVKTRCHNRKTHTAKFIEGGIRRRNQASYELFGFRLFDKVNYNGEECFIYGRRERGSFLIRKLDGETIKSGVTYKKLKLIERSKTYLTQLVKIKTNPLF